MSNPNFDPQHSTNHIWRGDFMDQCLEDDLLAMEEAIAGKAPSNHGHTGYSPTNHEHSGYSEIGHVHQQSEIPGLLAALHEKAEANHDHTLSQIVGLLEALAGKADLEDGVVPESQLPGYVDDVIEGELYNNKFYERISDDVLDTVHVVPQSGKVYLDTATNIAYRWSGSQYVQLGSGLALGDTSATAYRGDHGKAAYDHSQNGGVHVTAEQKESWNNKQDAMTFDSEPTAGSTNPVTSGGVASALAGKAPSSHGHDSNYISKSLQMTADDGNATIQLYAGTTENLLTKIEELPVGVHTFYSGSGVAGNPKSVEGWRGIVFKTTATQGFVQAHGSVGSVFTNYLDGTNGWRGWTAIFDCAPAPLWTGAIYPIASHTVTPSKPLSKCMHGWMLLWSDYDPGTGANNSEIVTTFIPKRTVTGNQWNGETTLFEIPINVGTGSDVDTERRVIKTVTVYDNRFVGAASNSQDERNDVVLRAVYEF